MSKVEEINTCLKSSVFRGLKLEFSINEMDIVYDVLIKGKFVETNNNKINLIVGIKYILVGNLQKGTKYFMDLIKKIMQMPIYVTHFIMTEYVVEYMKLVGDIMKKQ